MSQSIEQKAIRIVKTAGDALEAAGKIIDEMNTQKKVASTHVDDIVRLAKQANLLDNAVDEATVRSQLQDPGMANEILKNVLSHFVKQAAEKKAASPDFGQAVVDYRQPTEKSASGIKKSDEAILGLIG